MATIEEEITAFLRDGSIMRGIDPNVVIRAVDTEGGRKEYARLGDFSGAPWFSGKSWWALQLHYGGVGTPYAAWGHSAGQGNGFTALTGWQPGEPKAWRDAARYGLNRVRRDGWGAWYGPRDIGITGYMGVDRTAPWDANSETWDYEAGVGVTPKVLYDPQEPAHRQEDDFDCSQESAEWSLYSVGRKPSEDWLEGTMIAEGVMTRQWGLMDATGKGLADFLNRHYGEFGFHASNEPLVTFNALASEAGRYPLMIGGRNWGGPGKGHWSGLSKYDAAAGVLVLKNPATGPTYGDEDGMTRGEMDARGPFSMVRLTHPDLLSIVLPPPPVVPVDELATLRAEVARLNALLVEERGVRGYLTVDVATALQAAVDELKRHKAA